MRQPATTADRKGRASQQPLLAPDKNFWERYSPHHEFPLSGLSAVALFGVCVGVLALAAVWQSMKGQDDPGRPPEMDAVEIEGGGGTDGFGPANPLAQAAGARTEGVDNTPPRPQTNDNPWRPVEALPEDLKADPLKVPDAAKDNDPPTAPNPFDEVVKTAKDQAKAPPPPSNPPAKGATGSQGGVKNPGTGGGTGGGTGTGAGKHVGPGSGFNKTGVVLSKQRKRSMRWLINFSGKPDVHLAKLKALQVLLAVPTRQPGAYLVWDMKEPNPSGQIDNMARHKDKVQWRNIHPPSMRDLAQMLKLPEQPPFAFIILPDDVEEKLLQLERSFRNLEESQIHFTEFEIQQRPDDSYFAKVVNQY